MASIIGTLERLGAGEALASTTANLPVGLQQLLLSGDAEALAACIGARTRLTCLIIAPEEEPQPDDQDVPEDVPDERPSQAV